MTPERIAEIRARLGLITPGQWHCAIEGTETDGVAVLIQEGRGEIPFGCCADGSPDEADCDFCAHAPDDIHDLLAHIDTLTAELADARRKAVEECAAVCRCLLPDSKRGDEIAMHTTDVLNAAMIGIRALLDKPAPEVCVCVWRLVSEAEYAPGRIIQPAWYRTGCGVNTTNRPSRFCCFCGKPIKIDAPEKEDTCPDQ